MASAVAVQIAAAPRQPARREWSNLLFVLPYLLAYVALLIYPLCIGMWLSLNKADLFGGRRFVGIENFVRLFHDQIFLGAVRNTFYFLFLTVPALVVIGLALALALHRTTRAAALFRGVFFSSSVLSVTIVTLLWRAIFIPDGGFLANLRRWFGESPIAFLSDEQLAMPALAITTIWWCLGLPMMLFIAALQAGARRAIRSSGAGQCGPRGRPCGTSRCLRYAAPSWSW